MASKQLKVSSFYGDNLARPYVVLDDAGNPVAERVDAPHINEALIEWAARVPVKLGGALVKPVYEGPETKCLKESRSDFQIFFQERYDDVLAANPALFAADRKAMLTAASIYWRERLSGEERAEYRRRSAEEKAAAEAAVAVAEEANPRFKAFREKMQKYKESIHNIVTAARVSTGPLWRAQRLLNAKYRLLEEQGEAGEREEQDRAEEQGEGGTAHKAASGKGRGRGGKKAAAQRRLVRDDSSESEFEEEEDGAEAVAAAEAMRNLLLATAKKGSKAAPASKHAAASKNSAGPTQRKAKAAAAQQEEASGSGGSEEEQGSPPQGQQQRAVRRMRSGAAALAGRMAAAAKGRKGYTGAFDLPSSQSTTPAKATGLPAKSPGKRTRGGRVAAVAAQPEAAAGESPAKRARRSARK